jgi:teichuronic acid biosynthesis glycosyltransferase TuaC
LRVLFVSESYPTPEHPGRAVFLEEQARALRALGASVTVLFPRPFFPFVPDRWLEPRARRYDGRPRAPRAFDPPVHRPAYFYLPRLRGPRTRSLAGLVREELARERYDLVHAHWLGPAAGAAVRASVPRAVPVVVTAHGGDVYRELDRPSHRRRALAVGDGAARVIAVAEHLARRLQSLPGFAGKVRVVPNGVDTERFRPVPRPEARQRLGWSVEGRVVLYAGALIAGKGVLDLVRAFAVYLARSGAADVRLVVAGTGPLAERLEVWRRTEAAGARLEILGWQDHDRMADLLAAADVFALPSHAEGNPVTVLESLACGTPVVGTEIAALAEILGSGRDGLLAPPGDTEALAAALAFALARPPEREDLARRARERYGWASVARKIKEVYEEAACGALASPDHPSRGA